MIYRKQLCILFLIVILLMLLCCDKSDESPITVDLNNKLEVAKIVARLKLANDAFTSKDSKIESKKKIKEILKEYGIDSENEIISFVKLVQKYKFQKEFNRKLLEAIHKQKNNP